MAKLLECQVTEASVISEEFVYFLFEKLLDIDKSEFTTTEVIEIRNIVKDWYKKVDK